MARKFRPGEITILVWWVGGIVKLKVTSYALFIIPFSLFCSLAYFPNFKFIPSMSQKVFEALPQSSSTEVFQ